MQRYSVHLIFLLAFCSTGSLCAQVQGAQVQGAQIPGGQASPIFTKTYRLKTIGPDFAEAQLRAVLDAELEKQTIILTDLPRGELLVQGPPKALSTIDAVLPAIDANEGKITVGLLPPGSAGTRPPGGPTPDSSMSGPTPSRPSLATNPMAVRAADSPSMVPLSVQSAPVETGRTLLAYDANHEANHDVNHGVNHGANHGNRFVQTERDGREKIVPAIPRQSPIGIPDVAEPGTPVVYRCRGERIVSLESRLRDLYGSRVDVCIAVKKELKTGVFRLCVLAPDSIHANIRSLLQQNGDLLPPADTLEEEGTVIRIVRGKTSLPAPGKEGRASTSVSAKTS
ncbi:MAG TPA: hypothetical protein DEB39_01735, partial [Planctomycetaceae bacterium]|nr:hypothetical protein [Planctomycetaceae bacterium]